MIEDQHLVGHLLDLQTIARESLIPRLDQQLRGGLSCGAAPPRLLKNPLGGLTGLHQDLTLVNLGQRDGLACSCELPSVGLPGGLLAARLSSRDPMDDFEIHMHALGQVEDVPRLLRSFRDEGYSVDDVAAMVRVV